MYIQRNPTPTKELEKGYLQNFLFKKYPPSQKNADTLYQIEFFLGFLNKDFNYDHMEIYDYGLTFSEKAYEKIEKDPFSSKKSIKEIYDTVLLKKKDSLLVKYYLREDILAMKIINRNSRLTKDEIYEYELLLTTLKSSPFNLNFIEVEKMINNIKKENNLLKQWQGTYSFDYGRTHMEQVTSGEVTFKIAETSQRVFFDEQEKPLTVRAAYKDSILLRGDDEKDYVIYRTSPNEYAVKGHHIYMLSPPNNDYPLTKTE